MNALRLIVGLGNVGAEYELTRHNAGFWLVDELAEKLGVSWSEEKKFFGAVARARINGEETRLLKPSTLMNRSGLAVAAVARFYRIKPAEILVIHDELDLKCGSLKLKCGGGNGGHNGIKSIESCLGDSDFWRLRLGIGHPGDKNLVVAHVLKKPPAEEMRLIRLALDRAVPEIPGMVAGDFDAAMRVLHGKPRRDLRH